MEVKNAAQAKGYATILIVVVGLIVAVIAVKKIFGGIDGLMERIGLKDTKSEQENTATVEKIVEKAAAVGSGSPWSPKMFSTIKGGKIFTAASAAALCAKIWDSVGRVYDSPNLASGAIKQCYTKTQVSFLAHTFFAKYGVDLLTWLEYKFDTNEQKKVLAGILTYVDNLPLSQPK